MKTRVERGRGNVCGGRVGESHDRRRQFSRFLLGGQQVRGMLTRGRFTAGLREV